MTVVVAGPQELYDRNPVQQAQTYFNDSLIPAAEIARWSYTVPSGKISLVAVASLWAMRQSAATGLGEVSVTIELTPSGGSAQRLLFRSFVSNTVGASVGAEIGTSMFLLAGDRIRGLTADTGTGGTVEFQLSAQVIEFDA